MGMTDRDQGCPSDANVNRSSNLSNHQWTTPTGSTQNSDCDADVEVVKPYAVEEPDDEPDDNPTHQPHRPVVSSLPDNFERWHVDLIDSMDNLQSDSDTNDSVFRSEQRRGKKRKPGSGACSFFQTGHPQSPSARSKHGDSQYEPPGFTRKRPRRRNKRSSDNRNTPTDSSTASNGSESCLSLSSAPLSTEASGTETGNMDSDSNADKMDID